MIVQFFQNHLPLLHLPALCIRLKRSCKQDIQDDMSKVTLANASNLSFCLYTKTGSSFTKAHSLHAPSNSLRIAVEPECILYKQDQHSDLISGSTASFIFSFSRWIFNTGRRGHYDLCQNHPGSFSLLLRIRAIFVPGRGIYGIVGGSCF